MIKRKPWIFELRDLWPESIKTVGAMKENIIIRFLEKIELYLYRKSSKVIAVTDAFKRNLISRGIEPDKIEVVTNGSNLELFKKRNKNNDLIKKLKIKNKFIIGYIGTHGMAHSLDFVINSISNIKNNKIHFIFIGDGAVKKEIVQQATILGLKNVTFLNSVPKEELINYLSIIDVSLVPLKKSDTFKTVIPSKIFEAAAMGKPIILGVEGQAKEIIDKYESGLCYTPEDENEFLEIINILNNDINLYKNLSQNCFKMANDFDRKKLANKMYQIIKELIS